MDKQLYMDKQSLAQPFGNCFDCNMIKKPCCMCIYINNMHKYIYVQTKRFFE